MGDIDFDYELWSNISREAKHFVANLLVYKQVTSAQRWQLWSHSRLLVTLCRRRG